MPTRMLIRVVTFRRPFVLDGFERVEPAGTYTVDTEEESLDEVSFPVWKRLATVMHITHDGATEYVRIDPAARGLPLLAEHAQAGATIQNEAGSVRSGEIKAGGIPAVAQGIAVHCGGRTPHSPKAQGGCLLRRCGHS